VSSGRHDATRARIEAELTGPLSAHGLDLEAVEITPVAQRRIVRVAVDKDGGITHDDLVEADREVSRVLDDSDVLGEHPYTLEVTSRGVDRPLTLPRHWRRNTDRLVKVTLTSGEVLTGRIVECDDATTRLEIAGAHREVAHAEVAKALVQIEFNRPTAQSPPQEA